MFRDYCRSAVKIFRRHKLYSGISIGGLAVGMACCFMSLVYLAHEMSFDSFHRDADSIFRIVRKTPDIHGPSTRNPMAPALQENFPEIALAVRTWPLTDPYTFWAGEKRFRQEGILFADPDFFRLFTYEFLFGEPDDALRDPSSVVLTQSASLKYFGSEDPVGRVLSFDGRFDLAVSAVIRDVPQNSHLRFEAVIPMERFNAIAGHIYGFDASSYRLTDAWAAGMFRAYIMLKENSDPRDLEHKFPGFLQKYAPYNEELLQESYYLQPLKEIHLRSRYSSGMDNLSDFRYILGILAIGLLILAMCCFNYINLTTARSMARRMEIGIRKVIGAHRKQLIGQFLTESLVMFLAAFILSLFLLVLLAPICNDIFGYEISSDFFSRHSSLLSMFFIGLAAAVLSGFYPALFFSAFRPLGMMKASGKPSGRGLRRGLVLLQFAFTICLMIVTGAIWKQVRYLKEKDLGYAQEQILVVSIKDDEARQKSGIIKQELIRLPGVSMISFSAALPARIQRSTTMDLDIEGEQRVFELSNTTIDEDFFPLFEIPILDGRNFSREIPSDQHAIILNERAVQMFNLQDPVGRELTIFGRPRTVIGVAKDFHFQTLHQEVGPLAMRISGDPYLFASVRLATQNLAGTLASIEDTFHRFVPQDPFEYFFFNEHFQHMYTKEEDFGRAIGYFAILAIVVSCLGLFGLALFITERRTREIGIRKALGSSASGIVWILSQEFARWVILANILAWPAAYLIVRSWLQNFAYRIEVGVIIFVFAGALALAMALLSVGIHSVKAATACPADSLRNE